MSTYSYNLDWSFKHQRFYEGGRLISSLYLYLYYPHRGPEGSDKTATL